MSEEGDCSQTGQTLQQVVGWSRRRSDLLFKGPLSSSGGSIRGCSLHRLVGHDAGGKLLLGPLKAGARGAVERMDLMGMWRLEQRSKVGPFQTTAIGCTFLNMIRDMAAREVKRTATMIMMMPTGVLLLRPVRAEIHPLGTRTRRLSSHCSQKETRECTWPTPSRSPGAPAGDANTLDHVDAELTDVHKEEEEEPEGAVTPAHREEEKDASATERRASSFGRV